MGKENDLMLDYLRDNGRFADLFNGSLFNGKQVVKADELQEAGENYTEYKHVGNNETAATTLTGQETRQKPTVTSRSRDIKKQLGSGTELRILAVEGQNYVDYAMPWRCMNYDALEYGRQVKSIQRKNKKAEPYADKNERLSAFTREDKVPPVYTICLYHGEEPWDGPRSLKDMVRLGNTSGENALGEYFIDYPMNLVCINELEDFSGFNTGLRELFSLMAYRNDKHKMNEFLQTHEEYKRLDEETADVISGIMGVKKFMSDKEQYQEEGKYNMCRAIREMWQDGWNDGVNEGLSQGVSLSAAVFRVIRSGITDNAEIAKQCDATIENIEHIRKAFDI